MGHGSLHRSLFAALVALLAVLAQGSSPAVARPAPGPRASLPALSLASLAAGGPVRIRVSAPRGLRVRVTVFLEERAAGMPYGRRQAAGAPLRVRLRRGHRLV